MKIKNVKIGVQLVVGLSIILTMVFVLGIVSYVQSNTISIQTDTIYNHPLQVRRAIGRLQLRVAEVELDLRELTASQSDDGDEDAMYHIELSVLDAQKQLEIIQKYYLGPKDDIYNLLDTYSKWDLSKNKLINNVLKTDDKVNKVSLLQTWKILNLNKELKNKIDIIDLFATNKANNLYDRSEYLNAKFTDVLIVIICLIFIISILVIFILIRNINAQIKLLSDAAHKVKAGDLNARCQLNSNNELGQLSQSFNSLIDSIQQSQDLSFKISNLANLMMSEDETRLFFKKLLPALSIETNSQMAAVYLLSDDKLRFDHYESVGLGDEARLSFSVDNLQGEFGPVLATREIQFIKRVPIDTRFVFQTVSGKYIPREIVTIPILKGNNVVAIISLASVRTYSEESLELIAKLFDTLTARVDGVLAYRKMRKFAEQLSAQNTELEIQKTELNAQTIELNEQNRELEVQKNQLNEASRLKTNFLSNMSHELRTPLNSVIALSGVLNRRLANKIPADEYSYLEVIERNGKHLLALINDILDISRIEAGKEEIELIEFDVDTMVNDVVAMILPQVASKKIKLSKSNNLKISINSDLHKCQHVLQNLISNAVKFTEIGEVLVDVSQDNDLLKIKITDTGIGISEQNLPHIFDEFRQADSSTSRRFGGSGLGLAIAKKYANLLGGTITVDSKLGQGSTFTFSLPLTYKLENRIVESRDLSNINLPINTKLITRPKGTSNLILLVEDSEPAIVQMKDFLEESGYEILVARNGVEALQIIEQTIPDAIVLDLMMPGVDGFSVLQNLREAESTVDVPVLILTAKHITREDLNFLKRNNVHQLIQKGDVNKIELLNIINNLIKIEEKIEPVSRIIQKTEKLTVLIVEDNADNMITVKAIIGDKFTVLEAIDGKEAIKMASRYKPDFILMDIALPDIDGIQAFNTIRTIGELAHIPILALTASAMTSDKETILAYGFDAYLVKPIDEKVFFKTINEIVYGK